MSLICIRCLLNHDDGLAQAMLPVLNSLCDILKENQSRVGLFFVFTFLLSFMPVQSGRSESDEIKSTRQELSRAKGEFDDREKELIQRERQAVEELRQMHKSTEELRGQLHAKNTELVATREALQV